MGWPQITMIVLVAISLVLAIEKNGQPKGNWSVGGTLFGACIEIGLLYAGGFFS